MMHGISILHTIISSAARNEDSGRIFSQRTLYTIQRISIPPHCHFERSEKSFSSPFSHDSFVKPFRGSSVPAFPTIQCFPFLAAKHAPSYRQQERSLGFARDDDTGIALSKHIRCTLREINPFPHTVISSAARNLPCTLLFLASFAKVFPFSAITHTTLSLPARKIPRLRSG